MRLVNPVGREVGTGVEASYDLRACMCSSGFAANKGTHDNCSHCGCQCDGNYSAANRSAANSANRAS